MSNLRLDRVGELLKRQLGEIIRRELTVDTCGIISVNEVSVAGDLKSAVVYVSVLGSEEQKKRGLDQLQQQRVRIQGLVAKAVVLKYTPTLRFVFDDSVVRGNRVLQLIEELEKENPSSSNNPPPHSQV